MGNNIRKKTITEWITSLFKGEKSVMVKVEGKPLHVNPPFESSQRLKRAITRLRHCKEMVSKIPVGDPRRTSWENEITRRENEIQRFSSEVK